MPKKLTVLVSALMLPFALPGASSASDSVPVLHPSGALSTLLDTTGNGFANFYVSAPLAGSNHWRNGVPLQYEYGVSWYSTMYPIATTPTQGAEIGLNGTWVSADNRVQPDSLGLQMCKDGANPNFRNMTTGPNSGNAGLILFQTIEGGMGWWKPDRFPSVFPKYRLNVTQNCYQTLQGTPGWGFYGEPTPKDHTAVIQVSNRILMPPDGITFQPDFSGKTLGQNWQALRLPNFDHAYNNMAGDNNWTLFLNSANFSGPLAFIAPQYWADGALINPAQTGLGLDHQAGMADMMSSEWEVLPYLSYKDANGESFSKIPNINLPLDNSGKFVLGGDFTGYTQRSTLFGSADSFRAKLVSQPGPLYQGGLPIPSLVDKLTGRTFFEGAMYGFQLPNTSSSYQIGPYFKQVNGMVEPVSPSEVPAALVNSKIPESKINLQSAFNTPDWWDLSTSASKEYSAKLLDGSIVRYRWFRFVDQPAFSRFKLTADEKRELQSVVVQMQQTWSNDALMVGPSTGDLVSFDKAVTVTPPVGLEVGYVPIVTRQYATAESVYLAHLAVYQACMQRSAAVGNITCTRPYAAKKSIVCVKGKYTRKVTAPFPKCPSGYRLKR